MSWTPDSENANAVYQILADLGQIDPMVTFEQAGLFEMQELHFYNAAASLAVQNAASLALAAEFDSSLVANFGFAYRLGFDQVSARAQLFNVLDNAQKTVNELSDIIGMVYLTDGTNNTGPKYY